MRSPNKRPTFSWYHVSNPLEKWIECHYKIGLQPAYASAYATMQTNFLIYGNDRIEPNYFSTCKFFVCESFPPECERYKLPINEGHNQILHLQIPGGERQGKEGWELWCDMTCKIQASDFVNLNSLTLTALGGNDYYRMSIKRIGKHDQSAIRGQLLKI